MARGSRERRGRGPRLVSCVGGPAPHPVFLLGLACWFVSWVQDEGSLMDRLTCALFDLGSSRLTPWAPDAAR